jgi:hypothetical protein
MSAVVLLPTLAPMTLSIGSVSSVSNGADTMASVQRHFEACEEEDAVVHGVS